MWICIHCYTLQDFQVKGKKKKKKSFIQAVRLWIMWYIECKEPQVLATFFINDCVPALSTLKKAVTFHSPVKCGKRSTQ